VLVSVLVKKILSDLVFLLVLKMVYLKELQILLGQVLMKLMEQGFWLGLMTVLR